jgi:hypothetical protein
MAIIRQVILVAVIGCSWNLMNIQEKLRRFIETSCNINLETGRLANFLVIQARICAKNSIFLSIADFAIVVYFRRGLLAESPSETDQLIVL